METSSPGGINTTVRKIAKHLSKNNNVCVFNPAWYDDTQLTISFADNFILIRGYKFGKLFGLNFCNLIFLDKLLKKYRPDVIHVHGYHNLFSPISLLFLKLFYPKLPLLYTLHYDLSHGTFIGKSLGGLYDHLFRYFLLKMPTYIISVSNYEANNIQKRFKVSKEMISVIPHGVEFIDIKPKEQKKEKILIYVGYLNKYKGVQFIINALSLIVYKYGFKNIKLKIIGEGNYKDTLMKITKSLKLSDHVIFIPFLPYIEVLKQIQESDVLLLLSASEAYGIVVAEALSLGTPCIVTTNTALEEFTSISGCIGVEYPPNPDKLAKIIISMNNKIKVGPFSNKIRPWSEVTEDYEKLYFNIINKYRKYF